MPDLNTLLQKYLLEVQYVGTGSLDLTTNVIRELKAIAATPTDANERLKALCISAGGKN